MSVDAYPFHVKRPSSAKTNCENRSFCNRKGFKGPLEPEWHPVRGKSQSHATVGFHRVIHQRLDAFTPVTLSMRLDLPRNRWRNRRLRQDRRNCTNPFGCSYARFQGVRSANLIEFQGKLFPWKG